MKRHFLTALLAAAFATAGFAQGPDGPPDAASMDRMRVDNLTSRLKLTAAQKTAASAIFAKSSADSHSIQESLRAARESLQDAVRNNDSKAIDQAASTIGTLTAQMTAVQGKSDAEFYQTLTPEQRTAFDAMPRGGPGGFGGPMGPPPDGRGGR